jgi:hypothetical protein
MTDSIDHRVEIVVASGSNQRRVHRVTDNLIVAIAAVVDEVVTGVEKLKVFASNVIIVGFVES